MQKITLKIAQNLQRNEQGEKLNKTVDKVLTQILGQQAAQIIYDYLESKYFIRRNEIAEKLDAFSWALREYLGTGALVIEGVILENLGLSGLEENKDVDFPERLKQRN